MENERQIEKKPWKRPEVKRLSAGSAEAGGAPGDDHNKNNTRS
jgi:hypothetical protein